jgi:hypothetical protein
MLMLMWMMALVFGVWCLVFGLSTRADGPVELFYLHLHLHSHLHLGTSAIWIFYFLVQNAATRLAQANQSFRNNHNLKRLAQGQYQSFLIGP